MEFNSYKVEPKGRYKFGIYARPGGYGKIEDKSECSYTLTNLTLHYSPSGTTYLNPDGSNYAYLTGTWNTYVNGQWRTSEDNVPVTPVITSLSSPAMVVGDKIYWNDENSATTTSYSSQTVKGIRKGVSASTTVNVYCGANTPNVTSSEITSFSFPSSFSSGETSYNASASASRSIIYTSGAHTSTTVTAIEDNGNVLKLISSDTNMLNPVNESVDVLTNYSADPRTCTLTVFDTLYTSATSSITVTQSGTGTTPSTVTFRINPGQFTPTVDGMCDVELYWGTHELDNPFHTEGILAYAGSPLTYGAYYDGSETDFSAGVLIPYSDENISLNYGTTVSVYYSIHIDGNYIDSGYQTVTIPYQTYSPQICEIQLPIH